MNIFKQLKLQELSSIFKKGFSYSKAEPTNLIYLNNALTLGLYPFDKKLSKNLSKSYYPADITKLDADMYNLQNEQTFLIDKELLYNISEIINKYNSDGYAMLTISNNKAMVVETEDCAFIVAPQTTDEGYPKSKMVQILRKKFDEVIAKLI